LDIITHKIKDVKIAEIDSNSIKIDSLETAIDLVGNLTYEGYDGLIVSNANVHSNFFDLKTGFAGDILQKFSNYKLKLCIYGDFEQYTSKSLKDFILECNKGSYIHFGPTQKESMDWFIK
jgi:hypothetical protein